MSRQLLALSQAALVLVLACVSWSQPVLATYSSRLFTLLDNTERIVVGDIVGEAVSTPMLRYVDGLAIVQTVRIVTLTNVETWNSNGHSKLDKLVIVQRSTELPIDASKRVLWLLAADGSGLMGYVGGPDGYFEFAAGDKSEKGKVINRSNDPLWTERLWTSAFPRQRLESELRQMEAVHLLSLGDGPVTGAIPFSFLRAAFNSRYVDITR